MECWGVPAVHTASPQSTWWSKGTQITHSKCGGVALLIYAHGSFGGVLSTLQPFPPAPAAAPAAFPAGSEPQMSCSGFLRVLSPPATDQGLFVLSPSQGSRAGRACTSPQPGQSVWEMDFSLLTGLFPAQQPPPSVLSFPSIS